MILFFNDTFLEKEYIDSDEEKFVKSCESLFEIFTEIKNKKLQFSSQSIIIKCCKSAIESFFLSLNKKDIEVLFLKYLENVNIKYWDEKGRTQDDTFYYYFYNTSLCPPISEQINNSTLAEASEVINRGEKNVLTINLPDLLFSIHYQIYVNIISSIDAQDVKLVLINCTDNCEGIRFWIDSYLDEKFNYRDFSRTPIDDETCLINKCKFTKVEGIKVQGRQVYQDISKRFWYVDNEHKGESAHIEVFDKSRNHIGESDLRGNIDFRKKIPGRVFQGN
jgi:hypothetical protein